MVCVPEPTTLHRRNLLAAGTAAVAAGLASPASAFETGQPGTEPNKPGTEPPKAGTKLPGYVAWKDADAFTVHSNQTLETKRGLADGVITPIDRLFIRNNVNPPGDAIVADRDAWRVEIAGVAKPATLTLADLKRLGLTSVATVLQCSGNGRRYMQDMLQPQTYVRTQHSRQVRCVVSGLPDPILSFEIRVSAKPPQNHFHVRDVTTLWYS